MHCFHHKIASVGYTDCIIECEEVRQELVTESAGNVADNEAADGCWNAKGLELCGVFGVLVEAKKVDVSKITFDALWKLVLVDEIKDEVKVWLDGGY